MASRDIGVSHPRHIWWYRSFMFMARTFLMPLARIKYGIKTRPDKQKKDLPSILVYNHVSNYDFICNVDMYRPYTRYIISDAMLRNKFNAFLFPKVMDFIYRRKGERADDTVETVKVTIQDGVSVGIAPEGGVTNNGTTEPVRYRTGILVKDCHCGMVTVAMHGGYFICPTWARYRAKGPMYGRIVGCYTKEQIEKMSVEEVNGLIARDIHVNHYEWNRKERIPYKRKCRAEWMERVVSICPKCKTMGSMHSEVDDLYCTKCGYKVTVDECGFYQGEDVVFDNMYDWDMWQRRYLTTQRQKWIDSPDDIITTDEHMKVSILRNNFPVVLDEDARVEMTAKVIRVIGENVNLTLPLDEMSGVTGAISDGYGIIIHDEYYQFKAPGPIWNNKQRFIRKILRGEPIGRDADGDIL